MTATNPDDSEPFQPKGGDDKPADPELSEKEKDVKGATAERDGVSGAELMDLQRKYRMMMGDRSNFQKHAKTKLRQQQ